MEQKCVDTGTENRPDHVKKCLYGPRTTLANKQMCGIEFSGQKSGTNAEEQVPRRNLKVPSLPVG